MGGALLTLTFFLDFHVLLFFFLSFLILTGHAIFKLTYLSNHDYKHLYFESDAATVNEIVLKVRGVHNEMGGNDSRCPRPVSTRGQE